MSASQEGFQRAGCPSDWATFRYWVMRLSLNRRTPPSKQIHIERLIIRQMVYFI
jgi:hypothetical protein